MTPCRHCYLPDGLARVDWPIRKNKKRNNTMKKMTIGLLAAALAVVVGCKPTVEQMKTTATAIGYAAGLVANETPIKDDARNAIVEILGDVRSCVPAEGQTFADAWTPVIKSKVAEFVASGKIDAVTGELVTTVAVMAAKGVDYLFEVRYPEARQYEELVAAGVSGAVDGFLTAFKPVDDNAKGAKVEYDKKAYEYFKKNK